MRHRYLKVARLLSRSAGRRFLLLEAMWWLIAARVSLKLFSFRRITGFLKRPATQMNPDGPQRLELRQDVSWAVGATARYLPGATTCFARGIAARTMLRRRGIEATLYYGAATHPQRGLTTHVWVLDGLDGVVGHQVAEKYHVLARYPELG